MVITESLSDINQSKQKTVNDFNCFTQFFVVVEIK